MSNLSSDTIPLFAETVSLVADAYREASLKNADMKNAAEALENIRNALVSKDIFAVWDALDEEIGLAEIDYLQPVLIDLRCRFEEKMYSQTMESLRKIFQADPSNGWVIWLRSYVEAISLSRLSYASIISQQEFQFPSHSKVKETLEKIKAYTKLMLQNRWVETLELIEHLASLDLIPEINRAKIYMLAAEIRMFQLFQSNNVKELIDKAEKLAPHEGRVMCGLGYFWLQTEKVEQAIRQFENAIKADPKFVGSYTGLGSCYEKKEDIVNAEDCYLDAITKLPGWSNGYVSLYTLYGRPELFKTHEERIHQLVKVAIAVDPEAEYSRCLELGEIYVQNHEYERAYHWFQEAINLDPNQLRGYISKGYAYLEQLDYVQAHKEFQTAINRDKNAFDGYWGMSWYYESQGMWEEALHWYEESLNLRNEWKSTILSKIAEMKRYLGRYSEAERDAIEALQNERENNMALGLLHNLAYDCYKILKKPEVALRIYNNIREIEGEQYETDYHRNLADMYIDSKNLDNARAEIETIFRLDQNEGEYQNRIALLLSAEGTLHLESSKLESAFHKYSEALDHYDKAIEINPNYVNAWLNKGNVLYNLSRYVEAIKCYDKAIEINPDDPNAWLNKGNVLLDLKRYDEAIKCYDKAIEINPDDAYAWNLKAYLLANMNKINEAMATVEKSLDLDPNNYKALDTKGFILYNLKRYDDAILYYDKAIKINRNYAYPWLNKGNVLLDLKRYDDAILYYDKAIEINPNYVNAWLNKGNVLYNLSRYVEAIKCYDKAIEINPDNSYLYTKKGVSLRRLKRYDEAIECYDKAIGLNADDAYALNCKAYLFGIMNRNAEALPLIEKSLQIDPLSAKAFHTKGSILFNLKRYDEAIECYDKAISLDPDYSLAWEDKASCLYSLKRYDEAIECYDKAISLDPENHDLYDKRNSILKHISKLKD